VTHQRLENSSPLDNYAPEEVALRPRDARFSWENTPLHWMSGDPYGSHAVTALNLFLPVAERWFTKLLTDALDYVRDERLREQILGFIGQEAIHARTHDEVLVQFVRERGIDPTPFLDQLEWVAGQYELRMAQISDPDLKRKALASGAHALSAAEHFTGVLGHWSLNNNWDNIGVDPMMADLMRWHGAEEVEHRHVSYNVAKYFGMDYFAQAAAGLLVSVVFFAMVLRGLKFLVHEDPALPNMGYARLMWRMRASGKRGSIPTVPYLVRSGLKLLRRDYSPVDEGSTAQAVAYLSASPAARAMAE
jgi:uncharacterized protein